MSISSPFPDHIAALGPYVPGQSIATVARRVGLPLEDIAKLASNENPLGASPRVAEALQRAALDLSRYPDNDCPDLMAALADALGVPMDWLVVGAGSESLLAAIATACLAPGRSAVYSQYSFQAFPNAVQRVGATSHVVASPDLVVDPAALLAAVTEDTALVYLANPGNPTGTYVGAHEVLAMLERLPAHITVLLDEAYCEFLAPADAPDAVAWVRRFPNLVVARTFSKAYGLAGLRVGYAFAQPGLASVLRRIRAPFAVTDLAQVAAVAALQDPEHLARSVAANAAGLAHLGQGLDALGLRHLPSHTNFVLVDVGDGGAVARTLETHGLIVRPVGGYGLPSWVRISVGTRAENARLLAALAAALPARRTGVA